VIFGGGARLQAVGFADTSMDMLDSYDGIYHGDFGVQSADDSWKQIATYPGTSVNKLRSSPLMANFTDVRVQQ